MAGPGRHEIYKTVKVEVPAELAIPTCERCGERWLGPVATQELEKIYSEMLLRMASEQLGKLADASVEQKRVESALGLSQGYLSHIKAGRNAPSPMLVSELVLLAKDPERRLKEVERFWRRKAA